MEFFNSAVDTLQTIVVGLGGALCVWGGINLLEGYGQDNPGSKSQGVKQLVAGGYAALVRQYQMEQEVKAIVQKNDTPRNRKAQKAHPRPEKKKLMPLSASTRATESPARRRPLSRMKPSTRMVCAALTGARSPSALLLRTSAISWPSRKPGPPSLNTCATCTTMWMPPSMCSFRF